MNETTISTIKSESSIRKSVSSGSGTSHSTTSYVRDIIIETTEKALIIWFEDQTQKRIPIDTNIITNLRIYAKINDKAKSSFSTSHHWLERFKQKHSLHNLKVKGELASANVTVAKEYLKYLMKLLPPIHTFQMRCSTLTSRVCFGKNAKDNVG